MNPGVTEEAGSTARTLIASLTTTPVILALVIFNMFYIASGVWQNMKQGERFTENQKIWEQMVEKAMALCPERK